MKKEAREAEIGALMITCWEDKLGVYGMVGEVYRKVAPDTWHALDDDAWNPTSEDDESLAENYHDDPWVIM